jgi:2-polyprenyl-3-methyl-5-hydroxy-6-metoxy-1,4-benzoquinol methylase
MITQDSRNIAEDNTEFIDAIKNGNIPPEPPDIYDYDDNFNSEDSMEMFRLKSLCNNYGMWAIVEQKWTKKLANWIGNRKCLEVMAGVGWLAKALSEHGVNIVATDDFSWTLKARHKNESLKEIYPDIIKEDAISAGCNFSITKFRYSSDLLISFNLF